MTIHATTIVQAILKCLIVQYPKKMSKKVRDTKVEDCSFRFVNCLCPLMLLPFPSCQLEVSLESTVDGKLGTEVSGVSEYFSRIMLEVRAEMNQLYTYRRVGSRHEFEPRGQ